MLGGGGAEGGWQESGRHFLPVYLSHGVGVVLSVNHSALPTPLWVLPSHFLPPPAAESHVRRRRVINGSSVIAPEGGGGAGGAASRPEDAALEQSSRFCRAAQVQMSDGERPRRALLSVGAMGVRGGGGV